MKVWKTPEKIINVLERVCTDSVSECPGQAGQYPTALNNSGNSSRFSDSSIYSSSPSKRTSARAQILARRRETEGSRGSAAPRSSFVRARN
jgi:hypothetical protein